VGHLTKSGPTASERGAGRSAAALLQRGQGALLVTLLLLTIGAWALTIIQAQSMAGRMDGVVQSPMQENSSNAMDEMAAMPATDVTGMAGMTGSEWSTAGLATFVVVWAVMMVAMMLPAVTPMVLFYQALAAKKREVATGSVSTWNLVAGYLLVWTAVGIGVYALVRLVADATARLGVVDHERWAAVAMGSVLVVAGLYQLTPLKHACLRQCQSPVGFFMGHWRDGWSGALRMGVVHGLYCLGCCWALFAVLVAAGVMSLAWMLLLTLVVFAEKVLPFGRRIAHGVGVAFLLLGVLVASGAIGRPWTV
jgi:predicted metal-binding membrane protein